MTSSRNWREIRLSECCEIVSGSTPRRERSEYWDGNIPWVTPKDLSGLGSVYIADAPEKITELGYQSCSTRMLPRGSVLYSSRAPIGLIAIAGRDMCTNQGFKSLVPSTSIDSEYLYWVLRRVTPRIVAQGTGTTFKEISKAVIGKIRIPVPTGADGAPDLSEQRRIAAILDKADEIRRKRQEAITLTEELLRSTFLEMFGDPVVNPKGWNVVPLEAFTNPERHITYGMVKPGPDVADGVPYVRVVDMKGGLISVADLRRAANTIESKYKRSRVRSGDLLISIRGHVGRLAFVPPELDGANITQDSARIAVPPPNDPHYLFGALASSGAQWLMQRQVRGVAVQGINLGDLRKIPIPMPPHTEQARFGRIFREILKKKAMSRGARRATDELFGALIQRAFRGEL